MTGRPPYKRPRVKVYRDKNAKNYTDTKIFPDGSVQSKSGLKVPKDAIGKATDALKVGGVFIIDMLNPMDSISGELGNGDYTGVMTWDPSEYEVSECPK